MLLHGSSLKRTEKAGQAGIKIAETRPGTLGLSFLLCKMRITDIVSSGYVGINGANPCKLKIVPSMWGAPESVGTKCIFQPPPWQSVSGTLSEITPDCESTCRCWAYSCEQERPRVLYLYPSGLVINECLLSSFRLSSMPCDSVYQLS